MRFRGITKMSVDAKGRLAMPKNHRTQLEESGIKELVVTADPSRSLLIYPKPIWEELEEKLVAVPNTHKEARTYQRFYLGFATDVELDGNGRMLLSAELRQFAGIDRRAVLCGQGKKFELWDERTFEIESENWMQDVRDINPASLPEALQNISF